MKKYKICVYAISKNEEKFVDRWYESIKDADYICVLDTGSTDNTVNKLKKHKIIVDKKLIEPWRFDTARNESMKLIPKDTDICLCLDLDEVLEKGTIEKIKSAWNPNITRLKYNYNWYIDENGIPKISFTCNKIHNLNYKWKYPVHEVLEPLKEENEIICENITINHYPDRNKSRKSYLKLLEQSVNENPYDDRNMHYLGREYMYYKKWNKSIDTLIKHLNLKTSIWKDERCASMRFIGRCYYNLKRYNEANLYYDMAIKEAPYLRDGYTEKMIFLYNLHNYRETIKYAKKALKIKYNTKSYINELFSNDDTIYDILSICYYYLGEKEKGLRYLKKAIKVNPNNERLKNNLIYFK